MENTRINNKISDKFKGKIKFFKNIVFKMNLLNSPRFFQYLF